MFIILQQIPVWFILFYFILFYFILKNIVDQFFSLENFDPDIQYLPLFAVNYKSCGDYFSFYHKKIFKFDKAAQFVVRFQFFFFFFFF